MCTKYTPRFNLFQWISPPVTLPVPLMSSYRRPQGKTSPPPHADLTAAGSIQLKLLSCLQTVVEMCLLMIFLGKSYLKICFKLPKNNTYPFYTGNCKATYNELQFVLNTKWYCVVLFGQPVIFLLWRCCYLPPTIVILAYCICKVLFFLYK